MTALVPCAITAVVAMCVTLIVCVTTHYAPQGKYKALDRSGRTVWVNRCDYPTPELGRNANGELACLFPQGPAPSEFRPWGASAVQP